MKTIATHTAPRTERDTDPMPALVGRKAVVTLWGGEHRVGTVEFAPRKYGNVAHVGRTQVGTDVLWVVFEDGTHYVVGTGQTLELVVED